MYEAAISFADSFYRYRIGAAAKGDAGSLRYAFQFRPQSVAYNKDDVSIETTMPPGVYEGYLMAGETPAQAIRDYAQYEKYLTSEIELSDEEKKEFGRLSALNELADGNGFDRSYVAGIENNHMVDASLYENARKGE